MNFDMRINLCDNQIKTKNSSNMPEDSLKPPSSPQPLRITTILASLTID